MKKKKPKIPPVNLPTHIQVPVTLMLPIKVQWPENITLREIARFGWMLGAEFHPQVKKRNKP